MIEFKYTLKDGAFAPEKAHAWDAGFDIRTPETFTIESGKSVVIDTGRQWYIDLANKRLRQFGGE